MKEETDATAKGFTAPGKDESPDYLHLIYLFYRHPSQAFEIVNSGKTMHGIAFFAIFVFIAGFLSTSIRGIYLDVLWYGFKSLSAFPIIRSGVLSGLTTTIEFFLLFATEAVVLLGLLWIMQVKPPLTRTLSVIFYSCAIACPFILIMLILDLFSGYALLRNSGIILYYLYLLPLGYLEYLGLQEVVKANRLQIIAAVVIAIVVHYLLFEPEIYFIENVLNGIF
ncbi:MULTISPECIES: hypothetical protein [unclassified Methanoculleus]|jgi:hypothetical protein|uniref:hypothetical protein n=1 Tax=unclassified Methanoculleus TaxID=2619537 RepID=UPI0025EE2B10|nr:hypothetical protein [Methanoculleus sp. UBA377]